MAELPRAGRIMCSSSHARESLYLPNYISFYHILFTKRVVLKLYLQLFTTKMLYFIVRPLQVNVP